MQSDLPRISIALLLCLSLGVAPITNIHGRASNERHVLYGLNFFNNTSLMPSMDDGPFFDRTTSSTNVTVPDGEDAFLVCSVMDLGHHVVSWLRHSDINLLSVGKMKYTQDPRYQIFHNETNDTWTMKIRRARRADEGFFECQVSTTPPVGHRIYLKVIDPELEMVGGEGERFAEAGSNLNLTCYIRQAAEGERKVLKWTHNDQEINHQSLRGGVFIITEHHVATVSHLMIKNLTTADSGRFSCSTSAKSRTSVELHVINDDVAPEAVAVNNSIRMTSTTFHILFLYFFAVNFIT